MENKKELIRIFHEILWSDTSSYCAEHPPWNSIEILDIFNRTNGSFLVLAKRVCQNLHKLSDYETFEYTEVYVFNKKEDKFVYQLFYRALYLHNYTYDGFQSIYNTRRYEDKKFFYDQDKKLKQIISDMKFLSEADNKVVLKKSYIEELRNFKYRYRPR